MNRSIKICLQKMISDVIGTMNKYDEHIFNELSFMSITYITKTYIRNDIL